MHTFLRIAALASVIGWPALATAHEHASAPAPAAARTQAPSAEWLRADPPPIAALYRITWAPADASAAPVAPLAWYFQREPSRVRLIKGDLEETWQRQPHDQISFERTFHADRRRVFYAAGELLAMNVKPEWQALGTFMDARDLAGLQPEGPDADNQWRLRGVGTDGSKIQVRWDAARQLPTRIERDLPKGRLTLELMATHEQPPADWPLAAPRGADYERLDATDLGDMEYDPFARKAEALDVRAGWREAHAH